MEVILDGPNVAANQIAEMVLPEGSFYRFQAPLTGLGYAADPATDDWSEPISRPSKTRLSILFIKNK
jgi:hypothetical protein